MEMVFGLGTLSKISRLLQKVVPYEITYFKTLHSGGFMLPSVCSVYASVYGRIRGVYGN